MTVEYATVEQVKAVLAPMFPVGGDYAPDTAAALTDEQLRDNIREASARVDNAIRGRYKAPVAPVDPAPADPVYPDPVSWWTRDIAAYLAALVLWRNIDVNEASNTLAIRCRRAETEMAAVMAGRMTLDLPTSDDTSSSGFAGVVDHGTSPLFGPDDFGDHVDYGPIRWRGQRVLGDTGTGY